MGYNKRLDSAEYRQNSINVLLDAYTDLKKVLDRYYGDEDYGPVIYDGKVVLTVVPEDFEDWDTTLNDGLEKE